jgi:exopolysaccharide production protein ExoZ
MRTIVSVQALRAVAALSVVLCHFDQVGLMMTGHADDPIPLYSLASGVDLFFVISGFIMVYSSEDLFGITGAWKAFLTRRIARIVPLYWATTAIAIPLMSPSFDWQSLLGSYFFIPYRAASGAIYPLHGVGWTLNFEMFFYALFAVTIRLPRNFAVPALCAVLTSIVLLGHWFQPQSAPLAFWSDPIILEFAIGMVIALLYRKGLQLPIVLRLCLIAAGAAAIWLSDQHMPPSGYRALLWGIPAAMIFAGTVLGKQPDFGWLRSPTKLLGDASYALYLIHPLVTTVIFVAWPYGLNRFPLAFVLSLGVIVAAVSSVAVWIIERRAKTIGKQICCAPGRGSALDIPADRLVRAGRAVGEAGRRPVHDVVHDVIKIKRSACRDTNGASPTTRT